MKLEAREISKPDMYPGEDVIAFIDGDTSVDLATFKTGSFSAPHGDCTYDFWLYYHARLYSVGEKLIVDGYQAGENGNFNYPDPDKSLIYRRMFISVDAGHMWEEVTDSDAKMALRDEISNATAVAEV